MRGFLPILLALEQCSTAAGARYPVSEVALLTDGTPVPVEPPGAQARRIVTLKGFRDARLNAAYAEQSRAEVNGKPTFWSETDMFIYWCAKDSTWKVDEEDYWSVVSTDRACPAAAQQAHDRAGALPSGRAWQERQGAIWVELESAGVSSTERTCSSYGSDRHCSEAQEGCRWSSARGGCTAHWQLFGPEGPNFTDVRQGNLGTCYFLAVLASVAHRHPEVIADLFVNRGAWMPGGPALADEQYPVYTVRFLLTGQPTFVAVDEMIPVGPTGWPVFVKYSGNGNVWPIVLEKAWAKVFGSFNGIEGGQGPEAFKAIAQAPVDVVSHWDEGVSPEDVWAALLDAVEHNYPMFASSGHVSLVGIAKTHAYAVLDAGWTKVNGTDTRTVRMYNPWSVNRYKGKVTDNDQRDGHFRMLLEEYVEAFWKTCIAKVRRGYRLSHKVLTKGATSIATRLELDVSSDRPFAVQLEWPSMRLSTRGGCDKLDPIVSMEVVKDGASVNASQIQSRRGTDMSNVRADLPGASGTYVVNVRAEFPAGAWVDEVVLNTYASEAIAIRDAGPLPEQPLRFVALAGFRNARLNGRYDERRAAPWRIGDRETYWATNGCYLYWCKRNKNWNVECGRFEMNQKQPIWCTAQARAPTYADVGQVDTPKGFMEFDGAFWKTEPLAGVASNSITEGASLLQGRAGAPGAASASHERCRQVLRRLEALNNGEAIAAARFDALFPPSGASVAKPGETCGDSAQGIQVSCSRYGQRWRSLFDVMGDTAR